MQINLRFRLIFSIVAFHLFLMGLPFCALAQTNSQFEILGSPADEQLYQEALSSANLENYRFQDTDRILGFASGVEFKLSSAQSLLDSGVELPFALYPNSSVVDPAISIIFRIAGNGHLAVTSVIDPNSKLAKIGSGHAPPSKLIISQQEFDSLPGAKQDYIRNNSDKYIVR